MPMQKRVYVVEGAGQKRLVETSHPSHAITHVAKSMFTAKIPTQRELHELSKSLDIEEPNQLSDFQGDSE